VRGFTVTCDVDGATEAPMPDVDTLPDGWATLNSGLFEQGSTHGAGLDVCGTCLATLPAPFAAVIGLPAPVSPAPPAIIAPAS
jgi:hypothetical protein